MFYMDAIDDGKDCLTCGCPTILSEIKISPEIRRQLGRIVVEARYYPSQVGRLCWVCGGVFYPSGEFMSGRVYMIGIIDLLKIAIQGIKNIAIEPKFEK